MKIRAEPERLEPLLNQWSYHQETGTNDPDVEFQCRIEKHWGAFPWDLMLAWVKLAQSADSLYMTRFVHAMSNSQSGSDSRLASQ